MSDETPRDVRRRNPGQPPEGNVRRSVNEPFPPKTAEPLSVECPHCGAGFKLRNRDLLGRRLPCPECGDPFTIQRQVEPADEPDDSNWDTRIADLDKFDDMEQLPREEILTVELYQDAEVEQAEPAPDTPTPAEIAAPPPARNRRRPIYRWLAAGLILAIMGAVLMVLFLPGPVSSSSAPRELSYLPGDCRALAFYRLGELSRSPFFQDHLTRSGPLRSLADQFRARTGLSLPDLESMAVGLKDHDPMRFFHTLAGEENPRGITFIAVVRTNKDWDRSRLIGEHTESASHAGQTYHLFAPTPGDSERWALYLADARTLIFGSPDEVKAAIDTAGRSPNREDLEFFSAPDFPILAASLDSAEAMVSRGPSPQALNLSPDAGANAFGAGLVLTGEEVRRVSLLRFETRADASGFVRTSEEAEQHRRRYAFPQEKAGSMQFRQFGRTVAVSEGGFVRIADALSPDVVSAPLALLARLGDNSLSPPADGSG